MIKDFFNMFVLKQEVDNVYPNGAKGLISKIGIGVIEDEFIIWGSMGSSSIFDNVISELSNYKLNLDYDDPNCIYVCTQTRSPPKAERNWLASDKRDDGRYWLYRIN